VIWKMNSTDEQQALWFFVRHEVLTAVLLKIQVFLRQRHHIWLNTRDYLLNNMMSHLRKLEPCSEFHHSALLLMWWTFLSVWKGNLSGVSNNNTQKCRTWGWPYVFHYTSSSAVSTNVHDHTHHLWWYVIMF